MTVCRRTILSMSMMPNLSQRRRSKLRRRGVQLMLQVIAKPVLWLFALLVLKPPGSGNIHGASCCWWWCGPLFRCCCCNAEDAQPHGQDVARDPRHGHPAGPVGQDDRQTAGHAQGTYCTTQGCGSALIFCGLGSSCSSQCGSGSSFFCNAIMESILEMKKAEKRLLKTVKSKKKTWSWSKFTYDYDQFPCIFPVFSSNCSVRDEDTFHHLAHISLTNSWSFLFKKKSYKYRVRYLLP